MSLFSRLLVATAESKPIRSFVTSTHAGRKLALRFVAGETLDQAVAVARELNAAGMSVSLDLLGEEVQALSEVELARQEYEECLQRIARESIDGNISVKLTQLGLAFDDNATATTLEGLANTAAALGLTITIDMEDSRYTSATVEIYRTLQAQHGNLGLALQAYLYRTPADLAALVPLGGHLRLCKGAYLESADVALTDKDDVDAAYARLLEPLMADERVMPAIATHDRRLIDQTRRLARRRSEPFEFQLLYGVAPVLQRELIASGYRVRVYLPYGVRWYPYLVRRLGERPANLAFLGKAILNRT